MSRSQQWHIIINIKIYKQFMSLEDELYKIDKIKYSVMVIF